MLPNNYGSTHLLKFQVKKKTFSGDTNHFIRLSQSKIINKCIQIFQFFKVYKKPRISILNMYFRSIFPKLYGSTFRNDHEISVSNVKKSQKNIIFFVFQPIYFVYIFSSFFIMFINGWGSTQFNRESTTTVTTRNLKDIPKEENN